MAICRQGLNSKHENNIHPCLQATGNRATLIDRLLRRFHLTCGDNHPVWSFHLCKIHIFSLLFCNSIPVTICSFGPQRQKTLAVPPPATELNNNMQVKSKGSSLNAVELAEKVKEDLMRSKGGQVIQQSGKVNQNQKLCRTFGHCKTDLDGEEVVKRVERKLASLEARVKNGEGGDVMKQRVELVRSRLQRYYFLAQLLPLSKRPLELTAFIEKYREQRLKENLVNNDTGVK